MCWQYCHSCTKNDTAEHSRQISGCYLNCICLFITSQLGCKNFRSWKLWKVWVKEHFSHGSTSLSDFRTEFCQVHQGFTETRSRTTRHVMIFASRDFFQVKRWYHSKETTNSNLGKFVASPNSLTAYGPHKEIPDRPVTVWTVSPVSSSSSVKTDWRFLTFVLKLLCNGTYKNP